MAASIFTLGRKSTTYSAPRYSSVCPFWRPKPLTSVTVMPCTPIADSASRTSSSLNGLMMAVTSFISKCLLHVRRHRALAQLVRVEGVVEPLLAGHLGPGVVATDGPRLRQGVGCAEFPVLVRGAGVVRVARTCPYSRALGAATREFLPAPVRHQVDLVSHWISGGEI